MNRENKFRAWDGYKMQYSFAITARGSVVFMHEKDGLTFKQDWIPMQFTGLLDKNGKEIYEGDIVKARYGEQAVSHKEKICLTVRYNKAGFELHSPYVSKPLSDMSGTHCINWRTSNPNFNRDWYYEIVGIEVIGNIYENSDLIT